MATLSTRAQAYKPISTYAPLDYKTFIQGVGAIRERYDRGRQAMTAYERLYGMDLGGNESAQTLMDQVRADVDGQLAGIREKGNYEDAEYDILDAATQFVSDPRVHALNEAQKIRQEQMAFQQKAGGAHAVYDFNPYSQHKFTGPNGEVQRFTSGMEKLENWQLMQKTLIGNIKADGGPLGLTPTEVEGLLQYGNYDQISDAKIKRVVDKVYNAYIDSKEGRQQKRVLEHEGQDAKKTIINQMLGVAAGQQFTDINAAYTADPLAKYKAAARAKDPGWYDPFVNAGEDLYKKQQTTITKNMFEFVNGGTELRPQKAYVGNFDFGPDASPQASAKFTIVSPEFDKMKGAINTMTGVTGTIAQGVSAVMGGGMANTALIGTFKEAANSVVANLGLDPNEEDDKILLQQVNNPNTYKSRDNMKALANQITRRMKQEFSFLADKDLEEGLPIMSLNLPNGEITVDPRQNNTKAIMNHKKGEPDLMVATQATVKVQDLLDINPELTEGKLEALVAQTPGAAWGTDEKGENRTVTLPTNTIHNNFFNQDTYQQWGKNSGTDYSQAHMDIGIQRLGTSAIYGKVFRGTGEQAKKDQRKLAISALQRLGYPEEEINDALIDQAITQLKEEYSGK